MAVSESINDYLEWDQEYIWHHNTQPLPLINQEPVIFVESHGCWVKDIKGNEYLDGLSGGVWCVNAGYGQGKIARAVYEQLMTLPYYAMTAGNIPAAKLAKKLSQLLPGLSRFFFATSGSEANETAFKITRQYFRLKVPQEERFKIVYRYRDYHGATFAALSATGQAERKMGYEPLVPGFIPLPPAYCYRCYFRKSYPNCEIDCARALESLLQFEGVETVAAIIVEPVTAGGGILVPCPEYFKVLADICRRYEILLIVDEVVTGFGRTGKMFGYQHWDLNPDIVTMAKGMASAYMPVSACAVKPEIYAAFINDDSRLGYLRHISTYGGNAAMCAAALANIEIMEELDLCRNSACMGDYLLQGLKELEQLPVVGEVRGKGLLIGLELVSDKKSKTPLPEGLMAQITARIRERGVLVGRMNRSVPNCNNVLTIAPPLILQSPEADLIIKAVGDTLKEFSRLMVAR